VQRFRLFYQVFARRPAIHIKRLQPVGMEQRRVTMQTAEELARRVP
jgi:hypothetical protein